MKQREGEEESNPMVSLSLNLSRARTKLHSGSKKKDPSHPDSVHRTGVSPHGQEFIPRQRRKRRRCDDIIQSLCEKIPIPEFDFELEQLERDFFDDGCATNSAAPPRASESDDPAEPRSPAKVRAPPPHGDTTTSDRKILSFPSTDEGCKEQGEKHRRAQGADRPGTEELLEAIEKFLRQSDPEQATANQCFQKLEQRFGVPLKKREKSWVRVQLTRLLLDKSSQSAFASDPSATKFTDTQQLCTSEQSGSLEETLANRTSPSAEGNQTLEAAALSTASKSCESGLTVHPSASSSSFAQTLATSIGPSEPKIEGNTVDHSTTYQLLDRPTTTTDATKFVPNDTSEAHQSATKLSIHPFGSAGTKHEVTSKRLVEPPIIHLDDGSSQDSTLVMPKHFVSAPRTSSTSNKNTYASVAIVPGNKRKVATKRGPRHSTKRCSLCVHCPCTFANVFETNDTTGCTGKSDNAVERALLRQLQTTEKNAEKLEAQLDLLRRKLKKHRKDMWRKAMAEEESMKVTAGEVPKSRFLPDSKEMDRLLKNGRPTTRRADLTVEKSKHTLFSFAANYQPTLTQMLGGCSLMKPNPDQPDGVRLDIIAETEEEYDDETSSSEQKGEQLTEHNGPVSDDDASEMGQDLADSGIGSTVTASEEASNLGDPVERGQAWRSDSSGGFASILDCNTSGYICQWDALFDESDSEGHLEMLGSVFDGCLSQNSQVLDDEHSTSCFSPVEPNLLSQRGRQLMDDIIDRIVCDPIKQSFLEASCPNWKENVCFALKQQSLEELTNALESVRKTKLQVLRVKEKILDAADARAITLEVFEHALTSSIGRLPTDTLPDDRLTGGIEAERFNSASED